MFCSIHTTEDESCHKKEVVTFIEALEAHFYHLFKIKISVSMTITTDAYYAPPYNVDPCSSLVNVWQALHSGIISTILCEFFVYCPFQTACFMLRILQSATRSKASTRTNASFVCRRHSTCLAAKIHCDCTR